MICTSWFYYPFQIICSNFFFVQRCTCIRYVWLKYIWKKFLFVTDYSLTIVFAMNDIDNSIRESSLFDQLHQHHTSPGVTLRGLHQTGVACDKGHGEHLQESYKCIYSIYDIEWYHCMVTFKCHTSEERTCTVVCNATHFFYMVH